MKALVSTILLVLILLSSYTQEMVSREQVGQNSRSQKIDFPDSLKIDKTYLGVGTGYPWLFSFDITYLSKRNIGLSINFNHYGLKSVNLPSDYSFDLDDPSGNPKDKYSSLSFLFVIDIRSSNQKLRPGFEAGLSMVRYKEANFQKVHGTGGGWFGGSTEDYKVNYSEERFLGLQARLKLEVLFKDFLGCEFSLAGNINKYRSFAAFEAILLIGNVREKDIPSY